MLQEPPQFGPELDPDDVLGLVGLDGEAADPALPCQVVSTGVAAGRRLRARRRRAAPRAARLRPHRAAARRSRRDRRSTSPPSTPRRARARARSFLRTAEMGEDPATGSAVGPLAAHVAARTGVERLEVDQGVEMGRPSRLVACAGRRPRARGRRRGDPGRGDRPPSGHLTDLWHEGVLGRAARADQQIRLPGPPLDGNGPGGQSPRHSRTRHHAGRHIREWYPSCPGASLRNGRLRAPGPRDLWSRGPRALLYLM